jgi:hypothetical protein
VRRHINSTLSDADADRILADATALLQTQDGADDVATNVVVRRTQGVDTFNTGNGVIQTPAQLNAVFAIAGDAKVVNAIQECGGPGGGIIGCAPVPGSSFIIVRFTNAQEGSLWAHEFGHNQGNPHRNGVNLVMNPFITATARRVDATESARYLGPASAIDPTLMAALTDATAESDMAEADQISELFANKPEIAGAVDEQIVLAGAEVVPASNEDEVREFIMRLYVGGVPYDEATRFTEADVPVLISVLQDPEMKLYWANAATVLGMIGGDAAADALITFARSQEGQVVDPETYRATLDAVLSLGFVVNRAPNDKAVMFLSETAQAMSPRGLESAAASDGDEGGLRVTDAVLANSAVLGLSIGARPETRTVLEGLAPAAPAGTMERAANSEIDAFIADALATHDAIAEKGLSAYYDRR